MMKSNLSCLICQSLSLCCLIWVYAAYSAVWSINYNTLNMLECLALCGFFAPFIGIGFATCGLVSGNWKMTYYFLTIKLSALLLLIFNAIMAVATLENICRCW